MSISPTLSFGTAGMRAPVGPAENHINVLQVTRISAAVATWFAQQAASTPHPAQRHSMTQEEAFTIGSAFHDEEAALRVVVGYDARYGSHAFATTAAEVFGGAGYEVFLMPTSTPTQLVPWLIKEWELDGGVQITASHNPSSDNGYKVYMANGRQLNSQGAQEIETLIEEIVDTNGIPRVAIRPCADQSRRYIDAIVDLTRPEQADLLRVNSERANIRIAFTAMHGVGGRTLQTALLASGFACVYPVASQQHPDPSFPTVAFPNPEEADAVAQLLARGDEVEADILIALDPDADRCAVGARDHNGQLRMLRGDETGVLLATRLVPAYDGHGSRPIVATTKVSTQLMRTIAEDKGWDLRETLTGFKNLSAAAGDQVLAYACEEAVGIAPAPHLVDDKDGMSTALFICAWAAELHARGVTLFDALDDLHRTYGVFVGTQISKRTTDPNGLIAPWLAAPPEELCGTSFEASALEGMAGVVLHGTHPNGKIRIIARASGTEPKVKLYLEVSQAKSRPEAEELLEAVAAEVEQLLRHL